MGVANASSLDRYLQGLAHSWVQFSQGLGDGFTWNAKTLGAHVVETFGQFVERGRTLSANPVNQWGNNVDSLRGVQCSSGQHSSQVGCRGGLSAQVDAFHNAQA